MSKRGKTSIATTERALVEVRFGGWHEGDNHKPGRGWYYMCRCGEIGLGQLLPASAHKRWLKHADRCEVARKGRAEVNVVGESLAVVPASARNFTANSQSHPQER